tara:strand:+ start:30217 stop:30720 length:504 start_codon:yes stop_codon:yes gene_type:complete
MDTLLFTRNLRFRIETNAPAKWQEKWKKFKKRCENGDNESLIEDVKTRCKLEKLKTMPYLKRAEGGLGGNDNMINKQLRFRFDPNADGLLYLDNDVVLNIIDTNVEKWSYEELYDIIRAFTKVIKNIMWGKCVTGCIELSRIKKKHCKTESDALMEAAIQFMRDVVY